MSEGNKRDQLHSLLQCDTHVMKTDNAPTCSWTNGCKSGRLSVCTAGRTAGHVLHDGLARAARSSQLLQPVCRLWKG